MSATPVSRDKLTMLRFLTELRPEWIDQTEAAISAHLEKSTPISAKQAQACVLDLLTPKNIPPSDNETKRILGMLALCHVATDSDTKHRTSFNSNKAELLATIFEQKGKSKILRREKKPSRTLPLITALAYLTVEATQEIAKEVQTLARRYFSETFEQAKKGIPGFVDLSKGEEKVTPNPPQHRSLTTAFFDQATSPRKSSTATHASASSTSRTPSPEAAPAP